LTTIDRLLKLVGQLTIATKEGRVTWDSTTDYTYVSTLRSGELSISSVDDDGFAPYLLTIKDSHGRTIDSLRSNEEPDNEPLPWIDTMKDLYELARNKALNIDGVIDGLMSDLGAPQSKPGPDQNVGFDPDEIPF
jgi:hypothetical protein